MATANINESTNIDGIQLEEQVSTSNPPAGNKRLYTTSDGIILLDSDGIVHTLAEYEFTPVNINPDSNRDFHYVGTIYVNGVTNTAFICTDNASSAAIWQPVGAKTVVVTNASGITTNVGDVGLIDDNGEYVTTTTEGAEGAWCVALSAAANGSNVLVQQTGRATINYTGTAPAAGDYLITSTTAGSATATTTMQPAMFAIAQTAGSGGKVDVLLYTQTLFVSATNPNNIIRINLHSDTQFESTINGAPTATSVIYSTVTAGAEDSIVPFSSSELGKIRLYNTTRGTYRLIDSVDTSTNTITTVSSSDSWASGDNITAESQTAVQPGTPSSVFFEIDLSQSDIPALARSIVFQAEKSDTGASNEVLQVHPLETYSGGKVKQIRTQAANVFFIGVTLQESLRDGAFCMRASGSGTGTATSILKLAGYYLAIP